MFRREDNCPACGHYLDAHSEVLNPIIEPAPGDLSVCIYCGVALEFNPAMKLQLINEHSLSISEKVYVARLRWAIKKSGPPPSARRSDN